ncbi:MAG: 50S ribosomal protein L9 [Bdellovibrionota bacterium]
MEVIFIEDCPSNGYYVGDRARVKAGFARNYLIPRKFAVEASSSSAKQVEHNLRLAAAKKAKLKSEAEAKAAEYKELKLRFKLNIGENGKVFGSITNKEIVEALLKEGKELDRKQIRLSEPLRRIGKYVVSVKLHSEVFAQVDVEITAEKPQISEDTGKKKPRKRKASAEDSVENNSGEDDSSDSEDSPTAELTTEEVELIEESGEEV